MQQILLQNATDYYKMRQVLYYKMRQNFYKTRQLLQNTTFIANCDSTVIEAYSMTVIEAYSMTVTVLPLLWSFSISFKVVFLFTFEIFASLVLMTLLLIFLSG